MNYLRHPVKQCDQVCKRFNTPECCDCTPADCDRTGWPEFEKYGFRCKTTYDAALKDYQIKTEIDNGRPVAFSWHLLNQQGQDDGQGHMMVIIGYSEADGVLYLRVNNPLPVNKGGVIRMTYNKYVEGTDHTHWDDYYDIH